MILSSIEQHFQKLFEAQRREMLAHYNRLLQIEKGEFDPGVYPLNHKLSGKRRPYPAKMPWMLQHCTTGRDILKQVMEDNGELDDTSSDEDEVEFDPCSECDLPDACADFGCAIKTGVRKMQPC